jgi:hypothetical protein
MLSALFVDHLVLNDFVFRPDARALGEIAFDLILHFDGIVKTN